MEDTSSSIILVALNAITNVFVKERERRFGRQNTEQKATILKLEADSVDSIYTSPEWSSSERQKVQR